ncbi:MAG: glycoside hydrolase family 15, partial [Actinobacteria bacterium]|nr:glycoside hydrolase family 15 [Actinomycetota bacterium]
GLHAASELYTVLGDPARAREAGRAAERLTGTVRDRFAGSGYQRYPDRGGADSALAMMMPPFQPVADPQVGAAFRAAPPRLARPGGGLAPGEQWREQTVSWTPETALFALASAAAGDRDEAVRRLTWLDSRRTPLGALPEKVLADGRPAGVAPLAWTAALVLLTLHELDGTAGTGCAAPG